MTWLLVGMTSLAAVGLLGCVVVWRQRSLSARSEAEARRRLEERLSASEARRFDADRRAEEAERSLRTVREAAGLDGARAVPRIQVEDLYRSGSLVATCLAGGDGLPHAGSGPLDAVESLASFAGAVAPRLPSGVTLLARDESGAELAARLVHVRGAPRVLLAESRGALSLSGFERTALRLDADPAPPPATSSAAPTLDPRAAPLLRGTAAVAALILPERGGAFDDPEAAARLLDATDVLEQAMAWLADYDLMSASSVQLRDARGTSALLRVGDARVAFAIQAEGLDVLTEQRLAGLARRRISTPITEEERAA